ncbi:hypothetical protein [Nocardia sp. alder85J]|uniref:hypothetical protein n=1 Tax=Nocardia sp. alder85J TaxID=2862949 RepID=UPI001CD203F1|nr:hypothetical protein [Nocardia sp. alder85J]MCX4093980.1 hypothetical protein [Nocardia sp. alder85J]
MTIATRRAAARIAVATALFAAPLAAFATAADAAAVPLTPEPSVSGPAADLVWQEAGRMCPSWGCGRPPGHPAPPQRPSSGSGSGSSTY